MQPRHGVGQGVKLAVTSLAGRCCYRPLQRLALQLSSSSAKLALVGFVFYGVRRLRSGLIGLLRPRGTSRAVMNAYDDWVNAGQTLAASWHPGSTFRSRAPNVEA